MTRRQLREGDRAPDFTLRAHTGSDWSLKSALERGPVVLFFYPKDDTPVCIAEACNFRDQHALFTGRGAEVVGVSRDSVESHQSFAGRYDLPFGLYLQSPAKKSVFIHLYDDKFDVLVDKLNAPLLDDREKNDKRDIN